MVNSKDFWRAYVNEANYAGGSGGAAYAETEPASQAALTADNFPVNSKQQYPDQEYLHTPAKAAGQAGDVVQTFTEGLLVRPGKRIQRVQNSTWIDKVVAELGNEGNLPTHSWTEVFGDGQNIYAAYGCYIQTYKLIVPEGRDPPTEEIDYGAYSVKSATAENFTLVPWSTTQPKLKKDFVLTVDTNDYLLRSMTLTIQLKNDQDPVGGSYFVQYPYAQEFEMIEVEFMTAYYDSDHFLDFRTETADPCPITIAGWGKTLTLANMKPKNESFTTFEQPEKGTKYYSGTFEMGGDVSPSTA